MAGSASRFVHMIWFFPRRINLASDLTLLPIQHKFPIILRHFPKAKIALESAYLVVFTRS